MKKPLRICSHYVFLKLCFNFSIECFSAVKENRINTGKIGWPTILISLGLRGTQELGTPSAKIGIIGHPSGRHCGRDAKTIDFNTFVSDLALQLTTCLSWTNDLFWCFCFLLCIIVIKQWISTLKSCCEN